MAAHERGDSLLTSLFSALCPTPCSTSLVTSPPRTDRRLRSEESTPHCARQTCAHLDSLNSARGLPFAYSSTSEIAEEI